MSEFKKAIKSWGKGEEQFSNYLSCRSNKQLVKLQNEISHAIIQGRTFSMDAITTAFSKPYDKKLLNSMLKTVDETIQERALSSLKSIQKYITELLPIVEKGIKYGELSFTERIMLNVHLKMAHDCAVNMKIKLKK